MVFSLFFSSLLFGGYLNSSEIAAFIFGSRDMIEMILIGFASIIFLSCAIYSTMAQHKIAKFGRSWQRAYILQSLVYWVIFARYIFLFAAAGVEGPTRSPATNFIAFVVFPLVFGICGILSTRTQQQNISRFSKKAKQQTVCDIRDETVRIFGPRPVNVSN